MKKYSLLIFAAFLLLPFTALAEDQPAGTAAPQVQDEAAPQTQQAAPRTQEAAPMTKNEEAPAGLPAWQGGPYKWYTEDFLPAQHFTLEPEVFTYIGYRFVGLDGKRRAAEYDYLHPSVAGGLSIHTYNLPVMVDIDGDYLNDNDHDLTADISFADILKLNVQSTELFHNLDHYRFMDPGTTDLDPRAQYGVDVNINEVKLIFKTPGIPFHLYVDAREFSKRGEVQQRFQPEFLNSSFGAGKTSKSRSIDWVTDELTAGFNGNILGLLEIDYHHTYKVFDSTRERFMVDLYTGSTTVPAVPDTLLAHNLAPKLVSHYDTVSLHTDQSKDLTAAGTFTYVTKKDTFGQSKVNSHREYGDITYRIADGLVFAAKYGHQRIQATNPEVLSRGLPFNIATPVFIQNPLITRTQDRGVMSLSYQPGRFITAIAQYSIDSINRVNAPVWTDEEQLLLSKPHSIRHTGKIGVFLEPVKHTKIRISGQYTASSNPSYNVDYRQAWEANAWASYVPMPGVVFNIDYKMLRGYNPVQNWRTDDQPLDNFNRHVWKDNGGAGFTWFAVKGLVVGAHYDYIRNKVKQTEIYENGTGDLVYSHNEPWFDTSHGYTLFAKYCFPFPLTLQGSFSQNWAKSQYTINQILTGFSGVTSVDTDDVSDFTKQRIRDTKINVRADYEIWRGWGVALAYGMSQYKDITRPLVVEDRDGTAHFGTALLTKKWL